MMKVKFKDGLEDFEGYEQLKGNVYEADRTKGKQIVVKTPIGVYTRHEDDVEEAGDEEPTSTEPKLDNETSQAVADGIQAASANQTDVPANEVASEPAQPAPAAPASHTQSKKKKKR